MDGPESMLVILLVFSLVVTLLRQVLTRCSLLSRACFLSIVKETVEGPLGAFSVHLIFGWGWGFVLC